MSNSTRVVHDADLLEQMGQRVFERKTRWRYERDGRDYGPFTANELRDEVMSLRIDTETPVFEEWSQKWYRVGDVAAFEQALLDAHKEREKQQLIAITENTHKQVKSAHSRRWFLSNAMIAAIVGVTGMGGYVLFMNQRGAPSQIATSLFRDLGLGVVTPWTQPRSEDVFRLPIDKPTEPKESGGDTKRGKRRDGATGRGSDVQLVATDSDHAIGEATSLSFEDMEIGGNDLPPLEDAELRDTASRAAAKAKHCFAEEAERRPGFSGATIVFSLEPTGKVGSVRLKEGGMVTPGLISCVRERVQSVKTREFGGASRTVEVPVAVSY